MDANEAVPAPVRAVMELFGAELKGVKFPGLDAAHLADGAAKVRERVEEVTLAEEALATARAALEQAQETLSQTAARALAYARIYAETDEALLQKVEGLALPRAPRRPASLGPAEPPGEAPKRRGRPPKVRPNAMLFAEESAVTADAASP